MFRTHGATIPNQTIVIYTVILLVQIVFMVSPYGFCRIQDALRATRVARQAD
jgi:hypothetical protein